MANNFILPYPDQLPQDYYNKNLPPVVPPVPPVVTPPPVIVSPPSSEAVNNGGIYYGDQPPANPQYGWLWTGRKGGLFVYMEPGVWSQVATNW